MDENSGKFINRRNPPGPALPKATVLLVENKPIVRSTYYHGLSRKGFHIFTAPNGAEALKHIDTTRFDLIIVNAPSMYSNGKGIIRSIKKIAPALPIILLLQENQSINGCEADVTLVLPFTLQKLLNRMKPLLPALKMDVLKAGNLQLDRRDRIARYQGRQAQLTPRLMQLLQMLMERPGEVIERAELFRRVWETDYVEDTRSLDVHISWLREALELDPRNPRLIKTIRGVGYRLDLGEPPTRPLGKRKLPS
jgi:DNA-binding response OmpR family regulator